MTLIDTDAIRVIDVNNPEWDDIVCSFPNYDVYYLSGYVKAFKVHGDGEPQLIYYQSGSLRAIYVFMLRPLDNGWYDIITPYGYGGTLFDGDTSDDEIKRFHDNWLAFAHQNHIVDNFVRYHPVIGNAELNRSITNVIDLGQTISIDIASPDVIWDNFTSKNRNVIRKAQKSGVVIKHGKGLDLLYQFMEIYNQTMEHDSAAPYYFFKREFYQSIHEDLFNNYEVFYAEYDGKIISMAIMIFANNYMNYHLSGSLYEYRHLAPSNLMLYQAALWGNEQGFRSFYLGGGVGSGRDALYKFKEAFNRKTSLQFSIGKEILDERKYEELVAKRKLSDPDFDDTSAFFPLYRS